MHLGLTTETFHNEDRSWLTNAVLVGTVSRTINPSNAKWIQADHYANGYIPSGVAVAYDVATARMIPFKPGGAGDELNFGGILYDSVQVTAAKAASDSVGVSILVFGFVSLDALPTQGAMTNGGLGANLVTARANMALGAPSVVGGIYFGA